MYEIGDEMSDPAYLPADDKRQHHKPKLRMALVGASSSGQKMALRLQREPGWALAGVCDWNIDRAAQLAGALGDIPITESIDELLDTVDVDAVAVTTPPRYSHWAVMTALRSGKDVLAPVPLADASTHALEMIAEAEARNLVLMTNRESCHTPAALKARELIQEGALGEILFIDMAHSQPGLMRSAPNVFWDLAPHDLALLDFVLPDGLIPESVSAFGADPLGTGRDCVGHLNFRLPNDVAVHQHVNCLSPVDTHEVVISGTLLTLVLKTGAAPQLILYDRAGDLLRHPSEHRSDFPQGVPRDGSGTTIAPGPDQTEQSGLLSAFAAAIGRQPAPGADSAAALRVVSILEAATRSLGADGVPSAVEGFGPAGDTFAENQDRLERAL